MKPVNTTKYARELQPGDLWVRTYENGNQAAVVLIQNVKVLPSGSVHATFDSNYRWAGECTWTEAIGGSQQVQVLLLLPEDADELVG